MEQQHGRTNSETSGSSNRGAAVDAGGGGGEVRYRSLDESSARSPGSLATTPRQQVVVFEFVDADGVQDQEEEAATVAAASTSFAIVNVETPDQELIGANREHQQDASKSDRQLSPPTSTGGHSCGCWPLRAVQVSPVQQRQAGGKAKRAKRRPRSESLELEKIRMHEKLLISNQKKLFSDLNQELSLLGRLKPPDEGGEESAASQVGLDMAAAANTPSIAAIECRELTYQAPGIGPQQKTILHGINLSVPEGCIYGLLGPSGCGKTTMLRCVAGRLTPTAGSIRVLGYEPNEPGSRIPGPAIGYMPQELSVYEEFTIEETLGYFGRINRMRAGVLGARIDFLLNFLNLPAKTRAIKTLSGGQKRRVSLAVALIHSPPLLILDEPTVGVDPLLRQIIWKYLVTLASADKITIVITTHYIEEARQANIVGLMRAGRVLAEDRPQSLMAQYGQASLENVFLKLCLMTREAESESDVGGDDNGGVSDPELIEEGARGTESAQRTTTTTTTSGGGEASERLKTMKRGEKYAPARVTWSCWFVILWAVTWKNYLRLKRNPPVIVFEFILPAFQALLFCLCIGGDPFDIPLAVVNEELVPQASRLFLNSLDPSTFTQVQYANLSSAIESVERGHTWAAVHIPEGYTRNLNERLLHPADATNETIANGTIQIYPDLTNLHLALTIQNAFRAAFEKFVRETLGMFGYDTQLAELPIRVARPIYGTLTKTTSGYLEFMAPGVIISITYVMATGLTALAFVLEKRDGLLERSQVSGVTTSQILLAHALLQVFVMVFQIALVLAVTFYAFAIPSRGPFALVAGLVLLQGCTGMAFGLLISAVCSEENTAVMLLVGTFYINLILAGIIWPVEAMPKWLRLFSYAQPQTLPTEGLRNILSRGWSINEPTIQMSFLVTIGWLAVFLLGAGVCMRYIK